MGFPDGSEVKNLLAVQKAQGGSLGWEDPLEKRRETHSSILAWRFPWTKELGRLESIGLQRVRYGPSDLACMHEWFQERKTDFSPQKLSHNF